MTDQTYIVRLECVLEALRQRNGELVEALPNDHPLRSKPQGYTRATRLNLLVDAALDHARTLPRGSELAVCAKAYSEYWDEVAAVKAARHEAGKKALKTQREKGELMLN